MRCFAIIVLLCIGACLGNTDVKAANDDPIINGNNVTDAPVTEVNPPSIDPPKPITTSSTTTPAPVPTTTPKTTTTPNTVTTTKATTTHKTDPTTKPSTTSTTTPAPTPTKPTVAPTPSSTTSPITTTATPHHERKFDGPSFIGGIILALGLVAIGFVAFKFYKARTEQNYHTL